MKRLLLLTIVLQVLIFSCSVNQEMDVNIDSSGQVSLKIELHPIFSDYLVDISDILAKDAEQQNLFDVERIKTAVSVRKGLKLVSINTPDKDILEMTVKFDHVENIITGIEAEKTEDVLVLTRSGGVNILDFHLTAGNFRSVLALAALDDSPLVDTFGPSETAPWDEEEYLDNVTYALEENASVPEIEKMFINASINVTVNVKGKIVSQKGGKISGKQVLFSIPLLRVLTLTEPLDLQIRYK